MLCTCPERQEVMQAPGKFITAVSVNGLEQATHNPEVHCENMQVASDGAPDDWGAHSTEAQDHDFDWRGVFSRHSEWRRILVVYLVNIFVQWTPVQRPMRPVVPCILQYKEDGNLIHHGEDRRKRNTSRETKINRQRMEKPGMVNELS